MKEDSLKSLFNGRGYHNPIDHYRVTSRYLKTLKNDSDSEEFICKTFEMSLISVSMGFYEDAANLLSEAEKKQSQIDTSLKIYLNLLSGLVEMDLGNRKRSGKLFREALEISVNNQNMRLEMLCILHINLLLSYTDREKDYCLTFEKVIQKQKPFTETFDLYLSSWIRARILILNNSDLCQVTDICKEGIKNLPPDSFQYLHMTLIEAETAFLLHNENRAEEKLEEAGQHPFCSIFKHMNCYLLFLRGSYSKRSDRERLNDLTEALALARQLPSDMWINKIAESLEQWHSKRELYKEAYGYLKMTIKKDSRDSFNWNSYLGHNVFNETEHKSSLSHLRLLNKAAKDLAGSSNYLELAELIQNTTAGQMDFTLFALGIHNKKNKAIQYVYIQENETMLKECEIKLDNRGSLSAICANSRQTIIHNNTESLPRGKNELPFVISKESSIPESVIYLPVLNGSQLAGILSFQHNEKYAFKKSVLPFLNELVPFIGSALCRIQDKNLLSKENREYRHFKNHDYLTGLPNKNLLDSFLKRAIPRAARESSNLAIMCLDLDNFRHINESGGHNTGDVILCTVAERLSESLRQSDFASRTGGDEFIMALESFSDMKDILKTGKKIIENINRPIQCGEKEYIVSASMGISLYPQHGLSAKELLTKADKAMYQMKVKEKNGLLIYSGKNM